MFVNRQKRTQNTLRSHPLIWVAAFYALIIVGFRCICPEWFAPASPSLPPQDSISTHIGTIDRIQRVSNKRTTYIVRLHQEDKSDVLISLSVSRGPDNKPLRPGDEIGFRSRLYPPYSARHPGAFRYDEWLKSQGASLVGYCRAEDILPLGETKHPTIKQYALRLRASLLDTYTRYLPDTTTYALVASLTLGDRSSLDSEVREQFADSGTSHVLALSGLHLSIIYIVYAFIVLNIVRRGGFGWYYTIASGIGIALIWTFVLIAGAPLSLIRAACLLTIMQVLELTGSTYRNIDRLSIAIILILAANPAALFDLGFEMSCACVAGIILISPLIPRWHKDTLHVHSRFYNTMQPLGARIWDIVRISLCAWLAVLGISAYSFHYVPLLGVVISILVIPLTAIIVVLGLIFFAITPLRYMTATLLSWCAQGLNVVTATVQQMPIAGVSWYASEFGVVAYYIALFVLCQVISRKGRSMRHNRRPWLIAFVIIALCGSATEAYLQRTNRLNGQVLVYNMFGIPAIHAIATPGTSLIIAPDTLKAQRAMGQIDKDFWQRYGIKRPQFVCTSSHSTTRYWSFSSHVLNYNTTRAVIADSSLSARLGYKPVAEQSIHTDWLILCRGCRTRTDHLIALYNPKMIILDVSLGHHKRAEAISIAKSKGIACHDLRDGYLVRTSN